MYSILINVVIHFSVLQVTNSTFANAIIRMLDNDPSLRCNVSSDCLLKVRSGAFVYSAVGFIEVNLYKPLYILI